MAILGIAAGLIGNALTGGLNILNKREDRLRDKQNNEHEASRWEHETNLLTLKSQAEVSRIEMSAFMAQVKGSFAGLDMSIKSHIAGLEKSSQRINNINSLVRPVITFLLLFFTFYIGWNEIKLIRSEKVDIAIKALITLIDLTSMSITWWFGDRSAKRRAQISNLGRQIRGANGEF